MAYQEGFTTQIHTRIKFGNDSIIKEVEVVDFWVVIVQWMSSTIHSRKGECKIKNMLLTPREFQFILEEMQAIWVENKNDVLNPNM